MESLLPMPIGEPTGKSKYLDFQPILKSVQTTWGKYKTLISVSTLVFFIGSSWLFIPWSKFEFQSKPIHRARIGVAHMSDTRGIPVEELPLCNKTMLYTLRDIAGLGSELSYYGEAAAVASLLNYTMILDDSKWNYGKLSDYFDVPPLDCRPPQNWREMPRTLFDNVGLNESDHVWASRDNDGYSRYLLQHVDSRAVETHAVWNLFNHREQRSILPAVQNLHHSVKPIFDAKSDAYRHIWKPNQMILDEVMKLKVELNDKLLAPQNKTSHGTSSAGFDLDSPMARKVISVQFRMGDKIDENDYTKPAAAIGMKPAQGNPHPFFEVVKSYVPDWKTSKELPVLFVLSDDPEAALKMFDEYQSFYPPSQRFPLIVSPKAASITEHGHLQSSFNSAPLDVRKKLATALIRDLTFAVDNSDSIVCSSASNLCNIMLHLRGSEDLIGPTGSCRSVDVRWFPNAMIHSLNALSLDAIKDRDQILAMVPRLATDARNYVDL
ncbi:uncharacterized protein MELLADRAFT_118052 [Melampsora larici-populina 98AG31]|uniref:Uncharacterized protein n=1 Tax=Melampsora larici-populina (strain 98AG31 / pathotype 3-4-7) TaxID=747676 RepID=F4S4Q1_MELLP|nr:uncharacterized protein MELLADRAFT_118052 [Melampsora larici-populina 98AG31]EGG00327.1 hypothetical protein MELLADRAFT_118052 [Melampsora larici-populina 98AG31]